MKTHIFIISWKHQHENAVRIAGELSSEQVKTTIVYSDPDETLQLQTGCSLLRRPDSLYFGDKFQACLEAFDSELFILIHADCSSESWQKLVRRCQQVCEANPGVGVWAPDIDYTGFSLEKTWISNTRDPDLKIVAQTDAIVFGLRAGIVRRLKKLNYEKNIYGWGIGFAAVAHAYLNQMYAVIDKSIHVHHPRPRGYPSGDALLQRNEFLAQLSANEFIQVKLLQSHMALNDLKNQKIGSLRQGEES